MRAFIKILTAYCVAKIRILPPQHRRATTQIINAAQVAVTSTVIHFRAHDRVERQYNDVKV